MTARKPIRRSSRYSIQSQMSGVLNPNSSNSEEEDNPLWFKGFEDNSATIRPSLRFGHVQDDTVLDSGSEPEATPARKSWWKDVTPEPRRSMVNASIERTNVSEKSLDASDLAVLNEGVAKLRSQKPRAKRKSGQADVFTDILASTSRASSVREGTRNSEIHDRESSVSLTDSSLDRIRQLPLKKKKKMTIGDLATQSNSDDDAPDIFQDALEAPESGEDSRPGRKSYDQPGTTLDNIRNTGTAQSRQDSFGKGGVPSDISEATTGADSDLEGRKSLPISQSEKRMIFTKTRTRKSAHFNDLLTNVPSEDEPSIGGEPDGNRSKSGVESQQTRPASRLASGSDFSIEEDDSISDESLKKQRPTFPRKKQLTPEERIAAMFSDSDTSTRSGPIAEKKTQEFVRPRDVSASDIERRSSKEQKDRSRRSASLNSKARQRQASKTPVRQSSGANKSVQQSGKELATPAPVEDEKNRPDASIQQARGAHESDSDERSISEEEQDTESFSHTAPIVEDNQPAENPVIRQSSATNKLDDDRRSMKEGENRSQRRSVNKENNRSRVSEYSDDDDDGNEGSYDANESDDEERTIIEEDDDLGEAQQPRKSPRQSNRIDESDVVKDSQPPRKSRGRSSRIDETDEVEKSQPPRKFHNRSIIMDKSDLVENSQPVRKSQGRRNRMDKPDEVEDSQSVRTSRSRSSRIDEPDEVEGTQLRRKSRGRSSRTDESDKIEEAQPIRKFHNRSINMNQSDLVENSQPVRKSQGRLSRINKPEEVEKTQPQRKSRSRSSQLDELDEVEEAPPTRKSRSRSSRLDELDEVEEPPPTRKSRSRSSQLDELDEVEEAPPTRKSRSRSSRLDELDEVEGPPPTRKSRSRLSQLDEPDEVEETQQPRKSRIQLSRVVESGKDGGSEDEEIAVEQSSASPDAAAGGKSSPIISVRRSGSANKSRDPTQDKSQSRISKKRLTIEDQSTSLRRAVESPGQDSLVSDDELGDDEILERSEDSSTPIRRSQMDLEDSPGMAKTKRREPGVQNVETSPQPVSTPPVADKSGDRRKSSAIVPRRPTSTHQAKKAANKTSTAIEKENDQSQSRGGPGNTEINASRFFSIQTTRGDQSKTSGGLFAGDKLTQLKAKLEGVKRQEAANLKYMNERKAILKNAKIDTYFKTISGNSSAGAKSAKKTATDAKPVNKAYIMNGKVLEWKKPKLLRPKKWATDRLYKFLWNKLEPKYDIRTRVRSEKFVKNLSEVAAIIQRRTKYENYKSELNTLLREMAHLGIINTRNDFHLFCQEFLPYEFRIKVIPMILPGDVRNIPFHPEKLHTPILDSLNRN